MYNPFCSLFLIQACAPQLEIKAVVCTILHVISNSSQCNTTVIIKAVDMCNSFYSLFLIQACAPQLVIKAVVCTIMHVISNSSHCTTTVVIITVVCTILSAWYFSFQPLFHNCSDNGCGMHYDVYLLFLITIIPQL